MEPVNLSFLEQLLVPGRRWSVLLDVEATQAEDLAPGALRPVNAGDIQVELLPLLNRHLGPHTVRNLVGEVPGVANEVMEDGLHTVHLI